MVDTCFCSPIVFVKGSKGYVGVDDVDKVVALSIAYFTERGRYRGLFFKKLAEIVYDINYVYYPFQLVCIGRNECLIADLGRRVPSEYITEFNGYKVVTNLGLIADLVILFYESSLSMFPPVPVDIVFDADSLKRALLDNIESLKEYFIPSLKGESTYMIPIIIVRYRDIVKKTYRTTFNTPICYSEGVSDIKRLFSTFYRLEKIYDRLAMLYSDKWPSYSSKVFVLEDPIYTEYLKKGLKKLWSDGVFSEDYVKKLKELYT